MVSLPAGRLHYPFAPAGCFPAYFRTSTNGGLRYAARWSDNLPWLLLKACIPTFATGTICRSPEMEELRTIRIFTFDVGSRKADTVCYISLKGRLYLYPIEYKQLDALSPREAATFAALHRLRIARDNPRHEGVCYPLME